MDFVLYHTHTVLMLIGFSLLSMESGDKHEPRSHP